MPKPVEIVPMSGRNGTTSCPQSSTIWTMFGQACGGLWNTLRPNRPEGTLHTFPEAAHSEQSRPNSADDDHFGQTGPFCASNFVGVPVWWSGCQHPTRLTCRPIRGEPPLATRVGSPPRPRAPAPLRAREPQLRQPSARQLAPRAAKVQAPPLAAPPPNGRNGTRAKPKRSPEWLAGDRVSCCEPAADTGAVGCAQAPADCPEQATENAATDAMREAASRAPPGDTTRRAAPAAGRTPA